MLLLVETPGGPIPLSMLASIEDADGPNQVTRDDGADVHEATITNFPTHPGGGDGKKRPKDPRQTTGAAAGREVRRQHWRQQRTATAKLLHRLEQLRKKLEQVVLKGTAFRASQASQLIAAIDREIADATADMAMLARNELRTAADLIADIVPPPAGTYPQTRKVLEDHTAALCARMRGDDGGPTADIGEEFVTTLRAEATFTGAAAAALPLVTAAANIGELELIYPAGVGAA